MKIVCFLFHFFVLSGVQIHAQSSVEIRVASNPEPVIIMGRSTLYYELLLTNTSKDSIVLSALEVVADKDSAVVARFEKGELALRLSLVEKPAKENAIPPGAVGIIYVEVSCPGSQTDAHLHHRLRIAKRSLDERDATIRGASILLTGTPALALGPPLRPGQWAAVYDPAWTRGHRRVLYTVNGKARIPGRFAIDFIKLDSGGRISKGDENQISNWYGYGEDVLAVADGVVSFCRDDFAESKTLSDHPRYPPEKATGNYVSLDLGDGRTVFYEHLKPGSIRVKQGQKIKKGDVVGAVGFTGQTTGPHLHLHVADGNSPLGAEGVPFVFEAFTMLGAYGDFEKFGKERWKNTEAIDPVIIRERPAPNSVVEFRR